MKAISIAVVLAIALVVVVIAGQRQRHMTEAPNAAFERAYTKCTDKVDADYQAKIDREFAQEKLEWAAAHPGAGELLLPKLMPYERPDYGAFVQQRLDCAAQAAKEVKP